MKTQSETLLQTATAMRQAGRIDEAIVAYQKLLGIEPGLSDSWYNLALLLRTAGRFDEALLAYDEALRRCVEGPEEVRLNRGVILADHLRREAEAESEFRAAIAIDDDYAPAWLNLGNLLEENGDLGAAAQCYERILPPADGAVARHQDCRYDALARLAALCQPTSLDDRLLVQLSAAAGGKAIIAAETRANLNYALGRALDALGAYDRAFAAFDEANRCVRKAGPRYERKTIVETVDRLIAAVPAQISSTRAAMPAPRPVFICGMFRSGSTLVEQALAAHPMVTAGGELNLLNRIADIDLAPYPETLRTLSETRAASIARDYRRSLVRLFPDSAREGAVVTDKRPDNFLRIGLIKRLFPEARIVHTVRDPVDTSLSVYFQHIDQGPVGYASDLADAGHYFGQYRRMMAHWKALYGDSIFDFDYDLFVREPRGSLQRLLEFLGLDWDERCLSFHTLKNPVKTASYWQVRQPLYQASSGRKRHYEKHLEPLRAALREAGVATD